MGIPNPPRAVWTPGNPSVNRRASRRKTTKFYVPPLKMETLKLEVYTPVSLKFDATQAYRPTKGFRFSYRDTVYFATMNALRHQASLIRANLKSTVEHWEGERPKFVFKESASENKASVSVTVGTSTMGDKKWHWLDQGTDERWAVMGVYSGTDEYGNKIGYAGKLGVAKTLATKTVVADFKSNHGAGFTPFIKGRWPMTQRKIKVRPGIEARGWMKSLQYTWSQPGYFRAVIQDAINIALGLPRAKIPSAYLAPYPIKASSSFEEIPQFAVQKHPFGLSKDKVQGNVIFQGEISPQLSGISATLGKGIFKVKKDRILAFEVKQVKQPKTERWLKMPGERKVRI